MDKIRLATAFSGIGSVEHAFMRLGIPHEIVFACDNDPFVKKSYFANYPISEDRWFSDVNKLDGNPFKGKVDLLVGGSPCQSFSMVGKRKGMGDKRGMLIFQFIRLVKETQTKAFIFENVRGLLNHDGGKTWQFVYDSFKRTGYTLSFKVLNAKDFGIPQNRERLFLIGLRGKRKPFAFPDPMPLGLRVQDLLEDAPDSKYFLPPKGIAFVTDEKNLKKSYTQIDGDIALCEARNQEFNWHGDFVTEPRKKVDDKYYLSDRVSKYVLADGTKGFHTRPKTDLAVARPLLSTMAKMHRSGVDNYYTSHGRLRKLTPRECLRLMGFDDRFKIVVSDTQMYKQAGNSIVSDIFIAILKKMYHIGK
jgi:DNA (cytosine-5)-methyltransferase 1